MSQSESLTICGNKIFNRIAPFVGPLLIVSGIMMFASENQFIEYFGYGLLIVTLAVSIWVLTIGGNNWLYIKKE